MARHCTKPCCRRALSVIMVLQAKSQEAVALPQRACTTAPFDLPSSMPGSVELGSRTSVAILFARAPFGFQRCSMLSEASTFKVRLRSEGSRCSTLALLFSPLTEDFTRSLTKIVSTFRGPVCHEAGRGLWLRSMDGSWNQAPLQERACPRLQNCRRYTAH